MSYSNIYNRLQHLQAAAIQQLSLASPSSQLPVSLMSPCTDYSCGTTPVLDFMSGGIGNPLALTMSVPSLNLPVVSQQNQMAQLSQLQSAQPSTPANEPDSSSIFSSAASAESQRDRAHLTLNFDGAMRRNTNVMRNMAAADSTVSPMALPRDLIDTILATTPDSQKYLVQFNPIVQLIVQFNPIVQFVVQLNPEKLLCPAIH
ncbi:hypothetical protein DdX_15309 [Ditylenchus destructor]|uniref:Uncharacterized protein n=1 Tax=Ditylenchus destructor TaxID=166010 RepID=A0AAD4QXU9_9BILA|nr:hypothetical protein DdX_15309 [Ditylenchus destructor]